MHSYCVLFCVPGMLCCVLHIKSSVLPSSISTPSVSVLIPYPRVGTTEILIMWSQPEKDPKQNNNNRKFIIMAEKIKQVKRQRTGYEDREHNTTKQDQKIRMKRQWNKNKFCETNRFQPVPTIPTNPTINNSQTDFYIYSSINTRYLPGAVGRWSACLSRSISWVQVSPTACSYEVLFLA